MKSPGISTRTLHGLIASAVLPVVAWAQPAGDDTLLMPVDRLASDVALHGAAQKYQLRGTVTAFLGEDAFYLQDATAGVFVYRRGASKVARLDDVVELIGTARVSGVSPHIEASSMKAARHGGQPVPLDVSGAEVLDATHDGRLVKFRARVASSGATPVQPAMVRLEAFGFDLQVVPGGIEDESAWTALAPGDLVAAAGVLSLRSDEAGKISGARLILRQRADLVRLAPAPWWLRAPTELALGGIVAALALAVWLWRRRKPQPAPVAPVESDMERRYRGIFESATDIILTHDLEGRITSFNPAGERLLGWPAGEVIGRPIYSIMAPAEAQIAGGLVKPGGGSDALHAGTFRIELLTRDGRKLPFEVNSWIEEQDGAPVGVQAICRNISRRLRSEDERLRFERKLQETQKLESLGILAGGIAHDFNNLLTAILGNASLARIEMTPGTPTQKSLEEIEHAAERASELCSQMLAYSGQGRFVVTRVDLSALVFETLELLQASVSKRAKLDLDLAENLPAIHGDTAQLRQVLMNLVINASEAFGDGPGTISVRTRRMRAEHEWLIDAQLVPEAFEGEYVMLEIADTGGGMNPDTAARMFEPFFTTKFTGRGLGLAAVLGIARSHRGAIKVETHLGQGTTFQLALPATGVFHDPQPGGSEALPLFNATVLVVDDEAPVRRTVMRALEAMGCKVVLAEDGAAGLQRVRQYARPFDLVLLDLTMPQMDGVETLRELRRMRPELPVILMSGFAQAQAMARFGEHRLAGFLQKPFMLDDLSHLVGRVLAESQGLLTNLS